VLDLMPDPGAEAFCRRSAYRFILQLQIEESLFQGKTMERSQAPFPRHVIDYWIPG
jgi:hypothetical protein